MTRKERAIQKALGTATKYHITILWKSSWRINRREHILCRGRIYHINPGSALYEWWIKKDISKISKIVQRQHKHLIIEANVVWYDPSINAHRYIFFKHCSGTDLDLYHNKNIGINPWESVFDGVGLI
jgi:hypothetical protein